MNLTICPTRERWQEHLRGALPAADEAELGAHLESCQECQRLLETLTAASDSLLDVARAVGQEPRTEETALRAAMGACQADTEGTATKAWTGGDGPAGFPFLAPPTEPGHLGRLAHYEVLEVLGRGGMGVVFKARDDKLNRIVAVKVLGAQYAASEQARKRFEREARAAAAISHDCVVPIYHVDEANGVAFLVMPLISGKSLQDLLDAEGPLGLREILRIGQQIATGLAAAHDKGLVHRDIKPANILLDGDDRRVKITDFGLARAVDDASLSQSGVVSGTPMYMSPEQARGGTVDHRSDLFSFGSVLYAMATGGPPFRATGSLAVLKRVTDEDAAPIRNINPDIPEWFEAIVARLHAKRPWERFPSAAAVAELLGQHLAHLEEPTRVPLPAPVQRPQSPAPKAARTTATVVLVVVFASICVVSIVAVPVLIMAFGIVGFFTLAARPEGHVMHAEPMAMEADVAQEGMRRLEPGFRPLFNHVNLDGWKLHPTMPGNWRIEDGNLIGTDPGGVLLSEREFGPCRFLMEAKLTGATDAAQLVRCDPKETLLAKIDAKRAFTYPKGYLAPIFHAPNQVYRLDLLHGGFKDRLPHEGDSVVEADRWFAREVMVTDKEIQIKVNGRLVADYLLDGEPLRGKHLGIQLIEGTMTIRRIEVKELDGPGLAEPAPQVVPGPAAKQLP
jgi:tRNA A-37 threonylcarbamoyl transferase component Bud32